MKTNTAVRLAVLSALALASSAQATIFNTGAGADASNTSLGFTVGHAFTATDPFTVNKLGAFDFGGNGFAGNVVVRLWSQTGSDPLTATYTSVAGATLGGSETLSGNFRYFSLANPVALNPGTYVLSAWYSSGTDRIGNSSFGDSAPAISLPSGWTLLADRNALGGDVVARNPIQQQGSPFFRAPNMDFTVVPEPSTYALVTGLGLVGFGLYRRRQSK